MKNKFKYLTRIVNAYLTNRDDSNLSLTSDNEEFGELLSVSIFFDSYR